MRKPILIYGLPGSGRTTKLKKLLGPNATIITIGQLSEEYSTWMPANRVLDTIGIEEISDLCELSFVLEIASRTNFWYVPSADSGPFWIPTPRIILTMQRQLIESCAHLQELRSKFKLIETNYSPNPSATDFGVYPNRVNDTGHCFNNTSDDLPF